MGKGGRLESRAGRSAAGESSRGGGGLYRNRREISIFLSEKMAE